MIKSLAREESYPPNATRHFHDTMDIYNSTFFKNPESGNVKDQTPENNKNRSNASDVGESAAEDNFEKVLEEIMNDESLMERDPPEISGLLCLPDSRMLILS